MSEVRLSEISNDDGAESDGDILEQRWLRMPKCWTRLSIKVKAAGKIND